MSRIEGSKPAGVMRPSEATKTEKTGKTDKALPLELPARPARAEGFDAAKKKLVSVSGRFNTKGPTLPADADLGAAVNGLRLSNQAGEGVAALFASVDQAKMQAGTGGKKAAKSALSELEGLTDWAEIGSKIAEMGPKKAKEIDAAIKAGKVTDPNVVYARLNQLAQSPRKLTELLKGLPKPALDGLKAMVRAGTAANVPAVAMAVSVEVAAQTKWGEKNPATVTKLREAMASGNVTATQKGELGGARDGKIEINPKLLSSPEGMAAVLAHEGTHLHQGSNCCGGQGPGSISAEVEGMAVMATVWEEIGSKTGSKLDSKVLKQMNEYAALVKSGGPAALIPRVGSLYIDKATRMLAARKLETGAARTDRKADDTEEAWKKQLERFTSELLQLTTQELMKLKKG